MLNKLISYFVKKYQIMQINSCLKQLEIYGDALDFQSSVEIIQIIKSALDNGLLRNTFVNALGHKDIPVLNDLPDTIQVFHRIANQTAQYGLIDSHLIINWENALHYAPINTVFRQDVDVEEQLRPFIPHIERLFKAQSRNRLNEKVNLIRMKIFIDYFVSVFTLILRLKLNKLKG